MSSAAAIPASRDHAEQTLHGECADAERLLPLGLRGVVTIEMKLRVVDRVDSAVAVVLLGDVDAGAMADAHAVVQVLEAEAKALAVAGGSGADVGEAAHCGVSWISGVRLHIKGG